MGVFIGFEKKSRSSSSSASHEDALRRRRSFPAQQNVPLNFAALQPKSVTHSHLLTAR